MSAPETQELTPRPTAAVRVRAPMSELDLGALFGEHLPNLAHRLADMGSSRPARPTVGTTSWVPSVPTSRSASR